MHFWEGIDRKYLQLKDLQRLQSFLFAPRRALDGQYSGRHATPQRGQSVEFRDFRQYMPGDEVANVDWKVYGRTDKLYVRIYENETELIVTVLVDASASMGYRGSQPDSKYDHACRLAAGIGFLVANQQDRIAFGFSKNGLSNYQRPSSAMAQLLGTLGVMERETPAGKAGLPLAIHQLTAKLGRGEILVLISDLWDDKNEILKAASQVIHLGGEVIILHVLHDDELELPNMSTGLFVDSESGQRLRLSVDDVRSTYQQRVRQRLDSWERSCRRADIDYHRVETAKPYHEALERYLCKRSAAI